MQNVEGRPGSDELLSRWKDHVVRLQRDLYGVHAERVMFKELVDAIQERAGETPGTWRNHYARLYLAAQSMALRRICMGKPKDITLPALIGEMIRYPEVLDLDTGELRADVRGLKREVEKIILWATKTIAHIPIVPIAAESVSFTFDDLDHAILFVSAVFDRYCLSITGFHLSLNAMAVAGGWQQTFTRALMPSQPGRSSSPTECADPAS
jgi:hypothetical protein